MNFLNIIMLFFSILTFFVCIIVLMENRSPQRTVAWLLVLIFLPVAGLMFYLYIGQNHRKKRTFIKKSKEDYKLLRRLLKEQINFTSCADIAKRTGLESRWKIISLLLNSTHSPITINNSIQVLQNGEKKFSEILLAIKSAKHHIHMEYFIIKDSEIGVTIRDALIEKANEGIEVRLVYDAVGSWKLKKSFIDPMKRAGIKVGVFLPVTLPFLGSSLNYRNHRKILIVDGKIGFLGGINIGDEYLGKSKKMGFWRDTHLKILGEAVYVLQVIFLMDWYFVYSEELDDEIYFPKQAYCGEKMIQIAASGPDSYWQSIHQAFFSLISVATERIFITTPYLIPDESISMALKTAALSGVDTRIILPNKIDHYAVFWASKSHYMELLEAGVRIYEYDKGFIHGKVILVDGCFSTIGTANLDIRSFQLNFEVNAFIYDEEATKKLADDFYADIKSCIEINIEEYKKRSLARRVIESLARLFSPIL
ncbi:MAG: cardiolipin synthase [Clostridiales bacterium]|nr:cardiolipin synthase [Clostridiales bacterium]